MIEMVRTPDERFYGLPEFPYDPNYVHINGGRMHYVDEGSGEVILCLHGQPTWSFVYRKMIGPLKKKYRVIAPDFFGFGRSDKFTRIKDYSFHLHYRTIIRFIEKLELKDITLVVHDWGGLIGLSVLGKHPELFKRVVIMNTVLPTGNRKPPLNFRLWQLLARYWPTFPVRNVIKWGCYRTPKPEVLNAYEIPFKDGSSDAGAKAFPSLIPSNPKADGAHQMKRAKEVLRNWDRPALVIFSNSDPFTKSGEAWFRENIPTAKNEPEIVLDRSRHFIQEDRGKDIAQHIHEFIQRSLAAPQPAASEEAK